MKITLEKIDTSNIIDIYDELAKKCGKDVHKVRYNVRYINCTEDVVKAVEKKYLKEHRGQYAILDFNMTWLNIGPKATLKESGFVFEIQEGFFNEE